MDRGDVAAAVDRHYPGLVQRLTLVLHDAEEAKDVAQEAYLKAFQAWDRFDGTDARAWLHTIALRLAFNRLRRRRLWDRWLRGQRPDASWVIPERIDLWRALGELKPRQRAALLLNVVDGYTQAEVARMLDAPEGAWSGLEGVLLTTSCDIERLIPDIEHPNRLRIELVPHSGADLTETYDAISQAFVERDPVTNDIGEVALDVSANRVRVTFIDGTESGEIVAAGGVPPAFATRFGTDGIVFDVMSRDDLPELLPIFR